jgi:hypothetical protein
MYGASLVQRSAGLRPPKRHISSLSCVAPVNMLQNDRDVESESIQSMKRLHC